MLLALGVLPVLGAEVLSIDQLKKLWGSTLDAKKNGDDFVANILFKAHEELKLQSITKQPALSQSFSAYSVLTKNHLSACHYVRDKPT
jgi:hypothetical protein